LTLFKKPMGSCAAAQTQRIGCRNAPPNRFHARTLTPRPRTEKLQDKRQRQRQRQDIPSNTISGTHAKRVKHRPIIILPLAALPMLPIQPPLRRKTLRSRKIPRGMIRSILMHTYRRSLGYIPPIHNRAALWHDSRQRDRCRGVDTQGFVEDGGEVAELGDAGEGYIRG